MQTRPTCMQAYMHKCTSCAALDAMLKPVRGAQTEVQTHVLCSLTCTATCKQCHHCCRLPGGIYLQVAAGTRSEVAGSLCEVATSGCQMQRPGAALLLVLLQQADWGWTASQPHASAHNLLVDGAFTGGAWEYLRSAFLLPTHSYDPDRISPCFANYGTI